MFLLNIAKWFVLVTLVVTNIGQTFLYIRIKNRFSRFPIVGAEISESKLLNHTTPGGRVFEAQIKYKYTYQGKIYEADTPALRSLQIFGPTWEFDSKLVDKYKAGDWVNVRVVPYAPELAYITIAPFSFWSAVLLPIITLAYALFIFGYVWFTTSGIMSLIHDC